MGTPYCGFQIQNEEKTVAGEIQKAVFALSGETIHIIASGRTDAGVHAYGQVIDFELNKKIEAFALMDGLNHFLRSEEVKIIDLKKVKQKFHSRFDAKTRSYEYLILNRRPESPILKNRVWHVKRKLNLSLMKEAAPYLIGKHDFTSFRSTECQSKSPIKKIDKISFSISKDIIKMKISAPSFLHNQVRIIIGTLVNVGKEKYAPEEIKKILGAKSREAAGITAPACGLYFFKVKY